MNAIMIEPKDDVAVAIERIQKGEEISFIRPGSGEERIIARTDIPIYHKAAVRDIKAGSMITKYAEHIGQAACDIFAGEHVHEHNVNSVREDLK